MACGAEPRRGNPDTRKSRRLNRRATSRLYSPFGLGCGSAALRARNGCRDGVVAAVGCASTLHPPYGYGRPLAVASAFAQDA